jgi:hypothetical protein
MGWYSLLWCSFNKKNKIQVTAFWVVAPCSLVVGNRCFGGHAASIFRVVLRGQGDLSTVLLPTQRGSRFVIPGIHGGAIEAVVLYADFSDLQVSWLLWGGALSELPPPPRNFLSSFKTILQFQAI